MSDDRKIVEAVSKAIGSSILELRMNSFDPKQMLDLIKLRLAASVKN
jgi:hypothetical protein